MRVVLAHGPGGLYDFFPVLFIGAAVWVITTALKDGQNKGSNTRTLPTSPLSRQVHAATRRPKSADGEAAPETPAPLVMPKRFKEKKPKLKVMESETADGRPAVPRRFEPPPYGRRKTG
jgi:hypothetical protein